MAVRKSSDLLPELFRTSKNRKFLNATLDQLISENNSVRINSFIGRQTAANYSAGDKYLPEISNSRQNFQLEPVVVYRDRNGKTESVHTYPDLLNQIEFLNGDTSNPSSLFAQDYYNWSGFIDYDKLVNYGEYFWLPEGPDSVQVFASSIDTEDTFKVLRESVNYDRFPFDTTNFDAQPYDGVTTDIAVGEPFYRFDDVTSNPNPTLYLARGGEYTFEVEQEGVSFWIQTERGLSGVTGTQGNISTREIDGVTNNGAQVGSITFRVPKIDDQNHYINMVQQHRVDFATQHTYRELQNRVLSNFFDEHTNGIDGVTQLDGKTLVFVNPIDDETEWEQGSVYDGYSYDSGETEGSVGTFDTSKQLSFDERYGVWRIDINEIGGVETIQLTRLADIDRGKKVGIKSGTKFGNREFERTAQGFLELIPPITAIQDTLFYQDGVDVNRFGKIVLVDIGDNAQINVTEDILDQTAYTSPNGVNFINGLKVEFDSNIIPSSYAGEWYVEGVGTGIKLVKVSDLKTPEPFTETLVNGYDSEEYDVGGLEETKDAPTKQDYILINRASPDLNAWSRYNRWFHRRVIEETAVYNGYNPTILESARAKRPVIEFEAGLQLFNYGTNGKRYVDVIDVTQTDALSNVNGSIGYFSEQFELTPGVTVLFTKDEDTRQNIYQVRKVDQDGDTATDKIIILERIDTIKPGDVVVSNYGSGVQGKAYWFKDTTSGWQLAQQKTKVNQEPLFDVLDYTHTSFSDSVRYPSSTFVGSKLFSYKRATTGSADSVLGFALSYRNFESIGDIVFENNYIKDTFQYTKQNIGNVNVIVKSGHAHSHEKLANGTSKRSLKNGWRKVLRPSEQWQVVQHTVANELYTFEIGSKRDEVPGYVTLKVYVNSKLIKSSQYTEVAVDNRHYVTFNTARTKGDTIFIKVISASVNRLGHYEIPKNLENNADNKDFDELTVGQIRNHLIEISATIPSLKGEALGSNNIRDIDYKKYPGKILQHSGGNLLPQFLHMNNDVDLESAISYSMAEYTRFKRKFIDNIDALDIDLRTPRDAVDQIIRHMAGTKSEIFPFFYTDMVAWGSEKTTVYHTIEDINQRELEFNTAFDEDAVGNTGILVYRKRANQYHLLTKQLDYTFSTIKVAINLDKNYDNQLGDQIEIVEYSHTDGNFVPPTPTKMGLWPKWYPSKYTDNSYLTPQPVVRGHDGSIWVGYGDRRDDIVLELEKRIFNNIKTEYKRDVFDWFDVIPGYYRQSQGFRNNFTNIYRKYFSTWAYKNRLNYTVNDTYDRDNELTWNYSQTTFHDKDTWRAPGYWRGIYRWLYDTDTPHTTPWELFGHEIKPTWWEQRYGPAPYTAGNSVLWEDARDGRLYTDGTSNTYTVNDKIKRPGIMNAIPVDQQGNLVAPNSIAVNASAGDRAVENPWTIGDVGPTENAWMRSSEYPFICQLIASVTRPSKYLSLMFDTNLTKYYAEYDQILQNGKTYRPSISDLVINGTSTNNVINRREGYNQFLQNYVIGTGKNLQDLQTRIQNLKLNLAYKVAGFTDKKDIKTIIEVATPANVTNNTIFLPDENLEVFLHKSRPLDRVFYSGINVIKRSVGYEIKGFDVEDPVFRIIPSTKSSNKRTVEVGSTVFTLFDDFEKRIALIPYGTVFTSKNQLADFLNAYNRYLNYKGLTFNQQNENGVILNFDTAIKEFGLFIEQEWEVGTVLSISPGLGEITIARPYTTINDLYASPSIRNNNSSLIKSKDVSVERIDNSATVYINNENEYLYSARLDPIQYEHILIFDNTTIFNDVIYQPELGNRQERLKLVGSKSGNWNGTLHIPGKTFNQDRFNVWQSQQDYKRADVVSFRNQIFVSKKDHTGTVAFDYDNWLEVDNMKTGTTSNSAAKADSFRSFYDVDSVNLESDSDRAGKGQIGFRNRDYLQNLGLDDTSQVKFYQGMIKNKGTIEGIDKLIKANLTNLDQKISTYEEWAFREGEYGSIDSNQVIELQIDEATAQKNPFNLQLIDNDETVNLDVIGVIEKNIYKKPTSYTKNLFLNRAKGAYPTDITNAGYARLDDVDFTVFYMDNIQTELNDKIDLIGRGDKIWVANRNNTWDMLRVSETAVNIIQLEQTTPPQINFTTDGNHGLVKDDFVLIKGDDLAKGVYKVTNTNGPTKFSVVREDVVFDTLTENLTLPFYKLESVRYSTPSQIATTNPLYGWAANEKIWVDDSGSNTWAVYSKADPYDSSVQISSNGASASAQQGGSLESSADGLTVLIGSPGSDLVTNYAKDENGTYNETSVKQPSSISATLGGFGDSVAYGKGWAAVGAPTTDTNRGAVFVYKRANNGDIDIKQVIVPSIGAQNDEFGYSLAFSNDDRFLFVGSPGSDEVYCYHLYEQDSTEDNVATITADGSSTTYALGFSPSGDELNVSDRNGKVYLSEIDYDISGSNIVFTSVPAASTVIVVRRSSRYKYLQRLSGTSGSRFGHSIACDAIGQTLAVGAPYDSTVLNEAGSMQVFHQEIERFIGDGSTTAFTTTGTIPTNMEFIEVNGTTLIPAGGAFSSFTSDSSANRYTRSGNTISTRFIPATGDIIEIYIGQWNKVQESYQGESQGLLASETAGDVEHFGWSIAVDTYGAVIAVGSPGEDALNPNTGSTYIFIDEAKRFGTISTKSAVFDSDASNTIFINNHEISLTNTSNPSDIKTIIDAANISEVSTSVSGQTLTISSSNKTTNNKLSVRPGTGTVYESASKLNFEPFRMTQKLNHPNARDNENFGLAVAFDRYKPVNSPASQTLVITSDKATTLLSTRFDVVNTKETLTFDSGSTQFVEPVNESGAAYVYALLEPAGTAGTTNAPKFAYGQQLKSSLIDPFDSFGSAVSVFDNKIFVGSKNDDQFKANGGSTYVFTNSQRKQVWTKFREQGNKVDVLSLNRTITYDRRNQQIISFLDTIDIAKGKLPGRAQAELNFIVDLDPAVYGVANGNKQFNLNAQWNDEYVGKTWWNTSSCRVLDYEQGELEYRRNNWNGFFPGSEVVVCEWVESTVLPSEYVANGGEGEPLYADDSAYSTSLQYNSTTNTTLTRYYFWVTNKDSYPNNEIRTMSTNSIEAQITDPVAAGLKFMSLIGQNAMMFNNIKNDLNDKETIVAINYDRVKNDGILHSEFSLVAEGDPAQEIPLRIWNKIVDSMSGADKNSNIVPDPNLSVGEKYGIGIRPRQTMFVNRLEATKVVVSFINQEFAKLPIVRNNVITGFTVSDPTPTKNSGEWNRKVADITTRDFINTEVLDAGYLILVESDSNFNGQWTIYKLQGAGDQKYWTLEKIQGYDTSRYWDYVTWYATGYSSTTVPDYQVQTEPDLLTLTQAVKGEVAKVLVNDDGNFSLFAKTATGWDEVVIEKGTIKLRDSLWDYSNADYGSYIGFDNSSFDFGQFDRVPHTELRQILNTIKNDIFINEQAALFNKLFFRIVEYAIHEQNYSLDWVFKTSFMRVAHQQRELSQYPTYKKDNSEFIEKFIEEVKPYHTKIREYVTEYDGDDLFQGDISDFDVHAFYDQSLGYFRKPSGDYQGDELLWQQGLNKPWNDNRGYYLDQVVVHNGGSGYITNPDVTISAPDIAGGVQAKITAISNGNSIVRIQIDKKGSGYTKTPIITVSSNSAGSGAVLLPRIKNDTHREFDTTLKFDRFTYSSTLLKWAANTTYDYQDLVWYQNPDTKVQDVYQVIVTGGTTTGTTFSTEDSTGTEVFRAYADESLLSAADRIEAYYVPTAGMVGDDLALLQYGTDYTGTRVSGVSFNNEPGFDSANFDTIGFDDFEIDTDGLTVLSGASAFDTTISSQFIDLALGTRPEDINIDGGAFVDEYSSHAPEEFVPGRVFDTLDMEIYTDPSDDYQADGNSFPITYRTYTGDGTTVRYDYAADIQADQVTMIIAYNGSTPIRDFTLNYETREIVFGTAPASGSPIYIYGYGSTGEKLTHEEIIIADGSTLAYALAVPFSRVKQLQVLIDGVETSNFTYIEVDGRVVVTFTSLVPANGSELHFLASAQATGREPFTKPVQQTFTLDGSTRTLALAEPVLYGEPLEGNMIVELNGIRLDPTNAKHYTLDGSTTYWAAPTSKGETLTNTSAGQVGVTHIKKSDNSTNNLDRYQDYDVTTLASAFDVTADSSVTTSDSDSVTADYDGSALDYRAVQLFDAGSQGDKLVVYYNNGEYTCDGSNLYLSETVAINNGDELVVTIFSNHDPLRIQTQVFKGLGTDITTTVLEYDEDATAYDAGNYDGVAETGTATSRYTIDRTLTTQSNLDYLWVTVDGVKLHPGQYTIDGNGRLDLSNYDAIELTDASIITMTSISENTVQPTTGFRIFYDMLGNTEYYRLCADRTTKLTKKLNPADTKVYVEDASKLTQVTPTSQYPGVLFVGNERITYWEIDTTNNYVSNIRRGTSGTRFANEHRVGATIVDASEDERLPQTNSHTRTWYDLGTSTAANGLGLQESTGVNATFLKDCEAVIPNYLVELSASEYVKENYVEDGYIEDQQ